MGKVDIKIGDNGCGSAVLEDAPTVEIEHVQIVREEGELPHAVVGVFDIDGKSLELGVAGADQPSVTVTWDGAPNAHVQEVGSEDNALDVEAVAEEPEPDDDLPDVSSLTRDEWDARAHEAGIEDPEALPNKDAVVEAIRSQE